MWFAQMQESHVSSIYYIPDEGRESVSNVSVRLCPSRYFTIGAFITRLLEMHCDLL